MPGAKNPIAPQCPSVAMGSRKASKRCCSPGSELCSSTGKEGDTGRGQEQELAGGRAFPSGPEGTPCPPTACLNSDPHLTSGPGFG